MVEVMPPRLASVKAEPGKSRKHFAARVELVPFPIFLSPLAGGEVFMN